MLRSPKAVWLTIAGVIASVAVLVLVARLFAPADLPWNAQTSTSDFRAMLDAETRERWDGRVDLVNVESTSEVWESDFPPSSGKRRVYLAWFQVAGTDAQFVVPFPPEATPEQLRDWGLFASDLPQPEADALVAYARTDGEPPVLLFGGGPVSEQGPDAGIAWSVTPLDRDGVNLCGREVTLIIRPDGTSEIQE